MTADGSSTLGVAHMRTVAFSGIDVKEVDVQVQISAGLPAFMVVGLPDKAVAESREGGFPCSWVRPASGGSTAAVSCRTMNL